MTLTAGAFYTTFALFMTALLAKFELSFITGAAWYWNETTVVDGGFVVTVGKTVDANTFSLISNLSGGHTANQIRRSKKIMTWLGFTTNANQALATSQVAAFNRASLISPQVEIASLQLRVYHFKKRPSGVKYEPNVP
jgi:hypothetical protein